MHPPHLRAQAEQWRASGVAFGDICRSLGLPRRTVGNWFHGERARCRRERMVDERCPFCAEPQRPIADKPAYAYLLGQYLGDGHLLTTQRVPLLTVACDDRYPELMQEVAAAMRACGAGSVRFRPKVGCTAVSALWKHWLCLFPQHGPGRKHHRKITLADWQQEIVDGYPERFLRGLFHSDGCRVQNRIMKNGKAYLYPRYNFANESADIMALCQQSLDRLGVSWRMCRRNMLSVARRGAVAVLDEHVGPKA